MARVSAGQLRERVRFTRPTKVRRVDGGYDITHQTLAERWAAVAPVSAREAEQSGRLAGRTMYKVTVRPVSGLTTEDAIVWLSNGNMSLNIREIPLSGPRAEFVEIKAEAGATA